MYRIPYLLSLIVIVNAILGSEIYAQSTAYILETGKAVGKNEKIYLKYYPEKKRLEYELNIYSINPTEYSDSTIFLAKENNEINVFIRPLNPLNYSTETENTLLTDEDELKISGTFSNIVAAAETATKGAKNIQNSLASEEDDDNTIETEKITKILNLDVQTKIDGELDTLKEVVKNIEKLFKHNFYNDRVKVFEMLKELDFKSRFETKRKFNAAEIEFSKISARLSSIEKEIENFNNKPFETENVKQVRQIAVSSLKILLESERNKLNKIGQLIEVVDKVISSAENSGCTSQWNIKLDPMKVSNGKITRYELKVYENGFELKDSSIVVSQVKLHKRSLFLGKKFKSVLPELSAGIAFTNISYTTFGAETDTTGQLLVSESDANLFNQVKFNAMLNFNLYLEESPITPFYQIGVAADLDTPTIFTGFGFRLHNNDQRFAISGGLALSFQQELNALSVGDVVTSSEQVDDDLTYKLLTPKPYLGLQFNF